MAFVFVLVIANEIIAKKREKRQNVQERKDLGVEIDLPVRLGSNNSGEVEGQLANLSMAACSYLSSNAGLSRLGFLLGCFSYSPR